MSTLTDLVDASKEVVVVSTKAELEKDDIEGDLAVLKRKAVDEEAKNPDQQEKQVEEGDRGKPSKKNKVLQYLKPKENSRTRVGDQFQVDLSFLDDAGTVEKVSNEKAAEESILTQE